MRLTSGAAEAEADGSEVDRSGVVVLGHGLGLEEARGLPSPTPRRESDAALRAETVTMRRKCGCWSLECCACARA